MSSVGPHHKMLTLHSTPESHGKDVFARMQRARERRSVETPCVSLHARYTRIWFGMRLSNAHVSAHIRYNRTKVRDVSPARVTLWDGRDVAEQQRYESHVQKMFFSEKISLLRNLSGANFCSVQARSTRDHHSNRGLVVLQYYK